MVRMGDVNGEPSMEEILSSIKRIIAEEGDTPGRSRRPARAMSATADQPQGYQEPAYRDAPYLDDEIDDDEVLELSDPMPMVDRTPRTPKSPVLTSVDTVPEPRQAPPKPQSQAPVPPAESPSESIVSRETAAATRAPLEALTRMMIKPDTSSDGTLEGLVREMLRPMLREWIDANLPNMVEDMVAREIAKIMNQQP
jgi:cell pole-organizing protein PopZ